MNIIYNNNTLYISMSEDINNESISNLRRKVFNIIDDYNIKNIVLNIINNNNNILIDEFIKEYKNKYHGNITLK